MAKEGKFDAFLENCKDLAFDGEEEEKKEEPKKTECSRCKKIESLFK